ncbi:hypothetical protein AB4Y32_16255 [Paraburkholderia phymatum]|uniref:Uncharacterized protein n=1 Tax=Paraburkholderia phymatum TaxID=148447 RepID=A0ACC6U121_9BURK
MSNILEIQGWSVSVEVDAETILTIGHNSLSGIDDFTEAQAQVIRNCAEHLLAFIGTPRATPAAVAPAVDAGSWATVEESCVGANLLVAGVQVNSWLGTMYIPRAHELANAVNAALSAKSDAGAREPVGVVAHDPVERGYHMEALISWDDIPVGAKLYLHPASEPKTLTLNQWIDIASRHANRDWNGGGYLDSVKAVCADYARVTFGEPPKLSTETVDNPVSKLTDEQRVRGRILVEKLAGKLDSVEKNITDIVEADNSVSGVRMGWGHWAMLRAAILEVIEWKCESDRQIACGCDGTTGDTCEFCPQNKTEAAK